MSPRLPGPASWDAVEQLLRLWAPLCLTLLSVATFAVVRRAPNDYTHSDPWGSLLVSQALIEHGSPRLDPYVDIDVLKARNAGLGIDTAHPAHYYWPPGTAVLALPWVWTANLRGEDMARAADNHRLQRLIAALIVAATVPLAYALGRVYLPRAPSLLLAVLFVFGSSVVSTLGVALWSLDFSFLIHLIVVLLLARDERRIGELPAIPLGFLLGLAYLCRPTAVTLAGPVLLYLALKRPRKLLRVAWSAAVVIGGLIVYSLLEFSRPLPEYYLPSRLGSPQLWTALYGNLLSPSRGIFILYPYLPLFAAGAVIGFGRLRRQPLFWVATAWLGSHLAAISSFPLWWGGHGFGNRLFADAFPGVMLVVVLVWSALRGTRFDPGRGLPWLLFALSFLAALFIHSYQGLYNPYTRDWNDWSELGRLVLDWSYPQFLASKERTDRLPEVTSLEHLEPMGLAEMLKPDSPGVVFRGFSDIEGEGSFRWSRSGRVSILWLVDAQELAGLQSLRIEVLANTFRRQTLSGTLNGFPLGSAEGEGTGIEVLTFEAPARAFEGGTRLHGGVVADLQFAIPGAARPASVGEPSRDVRRLGLAFRGLSFKPSYLSPR